MIHKVLNWFTYKKETLFRMFHWGYSMRKAHPYDACHTYLAINVHLKACYKCFIEDGHLLWNSDPDNKLMKRLRIAIILSDRLHKEEAYSYNASLFLDKYHKNRDKGSSWLNLNVNKDSIELSEKLYSHMFSKAIEKDYARKKFEKRLLYDILEKYLDHFWD